MPPRPPKLASPADRIRGFIAIVLTVACFTAGNYASNQQWQGGLMVAGILYMLTIFNYVFKDVS